MQDAKRFGGGSAVRGAKAGRCLLSTAEFAAQKKKKKK